MHSFITNYRSKKNRHVSTDLLCFLFQFLNVPMFRNVTLKCLTEIAGVSVNQYEEQFVNLFTLTMSQLKQVCTQTQLVLSASCINCTQCYNVLTNTVWVITHKSPTFHLHKSSTGSTGCQSLSKRKTQNKCRLSKKFSLVHSEMGINVFQCVYVWIQQFCWVVLFTTADKFQKLPKYTKHERKQWIV